MSHGLDKAAPERSTTIDDSTKRHSGGAASAAVRLDWIEPVEPGQGAAVESAVDWWNTGVRAIGNQTSAIVRVLNQETRQTVQINAGTGIASDWFLPWCNSYEEVTTKALLFRAVPPTAPSSRGSRLFYVFQDYTSDTAMWLPPGVPDFGMREEIETRPDSGTYLPPCSALTLVVAVNPMYGLVVPGGDVEVP